MARREYDHRSGELVDVDEQESTAPAAPADDVAELPPDAPVAAHLRRLDRRIATLTRLVLEIRGDRYGDDDEQEQVRHPSPDELHCRRCGFMVMPLERQEGHVCKRRADDPSVWAQRARSAIKPTVTTGRDSDQEDESANAK